MHESDELAERVRTRTRRAWAIAALALVLVGGGVWWWQSQEEGTNAIDPAAEASCEPVSRFLDEDSDPGYSVAWNGQAWGGGSDGLLDRIGAEIGEQVGTLSCPATNPDPDQLQLEPGDRVYKWSGIDPLCQVAVPKGDTVLLLRPNKEPAGVDCERRDPMPGTDGYRIRLYLHCDLPPVELNGASWQPAEPEQGLPERLDAGTQTSAGLFVVDADKAGATFTSDAGWSARYRPTRASDKPWTCR